MVKDSKKSRVSTRYRIRKKISGQTDRPRIAVFRSARHFYLQAIDDTTGQTIAQASSLDANVAKATKKNGGNVKAAGDVGSLLAKRLKDKSIADIVFDRGGFIYHGRVKAAAEAMRKAGLKF
jgi:large subunit ribosomal protein L18